MVTLSKITQVDWSTYRRALEAAREEWEKVREATSSPDELDPDARWFLSDDGLSGFGIKYDGHAVGLFSLARGRGDLLVERAKSYGGVSLDCFDGYLTDLYQRHGFVVTRREANHEEGGPDVVWMTLQV